MYIITHKKIFLAIGGAIMTGALAVILLVGIRFGIDFTGGALLEVSYIDTARSGDEVAMEAIQGSELSLGEYSVRNAALEDGTPAVLLRVRDLSEDERQTLSTLLTTALGEGAEVTRFTSVGPTIGQELKEKAFFAVGFVSLVIILYVAFAFRGVRTPVGSSVYGGITILALLHDILLPTAMMALLGLWFAMEANVLFVMALLAVLGYSVNDTIVVFDRVRENIERFRQEKKHKVKNEYGQEEEEIEYILTKPFDELVGMSLTESMGRSINTSLTTALALLALYFVGGEPTELFALVMLVGILAGTYSSIFLAGPLLVFWAERKGMATK
jgi:preprotein translocase subunit SecF